MASQGHDGPCDVVTPDDNIDNMTLEELRDALRRQKARADKLQQALMTEQARYAFLVNNHPLMQERLWLTRAFRTCAVQHAFTLSMM